jgi:hypothetical protein
MQQIVHEDNQKPEIRTKKTVAVRLPEVPVAAHKKIKKYRDELIRTKGRVVTLTEAYYEFLRTK